jgi:hypothetical protein
MGSCDGSVASDAEEDMETRSGTGVIVWLVVILAILVLIPLIGMLAMMAMGGMMGGSMMAGRWEAWTA